MNLPISVFLTSSLIPSVPFSLIFWLRHCPIADTIARGSDKVATCRNHVFSVTTRGVCVMLAVAVGKLSNYANAADGILFTFYKSSQATANESRRFH